MTGLLFGIAPAWSAARSGGEQQPERVFANGDAAAQGLGRESAGWLSDCALDTAGDWCRVVSADAGRLVSVDAGFRTDHLLLFEINPPRRDIPRQGRASAQAAGAGFCCRAGVEAVTADGYAVHERQHIDQSLHAEWRVRIRQGKGRTERKPVGNHFFATMGIPIIAGRAFGPQDTASSPKVAVINQSLARKRFPHGNPVGNGSKRGDDAKGAWIQVVGICADTRYANLARRPSAAVLHAVCAADRSGRADLCDSDAASEPAASCPRCGKRWRKLTATCPLSMLRTQQEQIDDTMSTERTLAALAGGFGLLALALACVGIYGIMAYSVANRRNEIGIRLALGAQPGQVRGMILRESTWLAVAGIASGRGRGAGLDAAGEVDAVWDSGRTIRRRFAAGFCFCWQWRWRRVGFRRGGRRGCSRWRRCGMSETGIGEEGSVFSWQLPVNS